MTQRNVEESTHQSPGHSHHIRTQPEIVQYPKIYGNGLNLNNFLVHGTQIFNNVQ